MKTTRSGPSGKSTGRNRVYFFSDAHLGLGTIEEDRQKESRIVHFLDSIRNNAEHIFIVGDLFDYWFEYRSVVPKGYFRLLSKLAELTDLNIPVSMIAGNHDFWVKDYFKNELGMEILLEPVGMNINGKKFYIHHGDGLLKGDIGYKILKKILRNKLNIFLFSLVHPDITGWIARWSSRTSRRYTSKKVYEGNGMAEFAAEKIREGYDYVVMGHNHSQSHQKIGTGEYINLGDWISENTYAVFDGKKMQLKKWVD
jgi:UDP-2,3-diacylglucosamine hydrolase